MGCSNKRVHRYQTQGRRSIDDDEVIRNGQEIEAILEAKSGVEFTDELPLQLGQVDAGGQQVDVLEVGLSDDLFEGERRIGQQIVDREVRFRLGGEGDGTVGLWVEIGDENLLSTEPERGGEVDRRSGLPDPSLLVGDGDS